MSASAKIIGLLIALVSMAVAGKTPAQAVAEIKAMAGDYWPHLFPLLLAEGIERAAGLVPDIVAHRKWFDALAAEISGNGKKKNGRASTAKPKPAAAPAAATSKAGAAARWKGRSAGNP